MKMLAKLIRILIFIIAGLSSVYCSPVDNPDNCVNRTQFSKIDALTTLQNGTILLMREPNYWILPSADQAPTISGSRSYITLLGKVYHDHPAHSKLNSNKTDEINHQYAVANVRIRAHNGECLPANQLILYATSTESVDNATFIVFENDSRNVVKDISEIDFLSAAKSIEWQKPITAISYWNQMVIIFQGERFVTVNCENGIWHEIVSHNIRQVFPGLPEYSLPDTVMVRETKFDTFSGTPIDRKSADTSETSASGIVYLFYETEFYKCDVTGNAVCEGPYDLLSEFLNVSNTCVVGCLHNSTLRFLFKTLFVLLLIVTALTIIYVILFRPVKYQYLISAKHNNNGNGNQREENYYETLKFTPEHSILKSEQPAETIVTPEEVHNKTLSQ